MYKFKTVEKLYSIWQQQDFFYPLNSQVQKHESENFKTSALTYLEGVSFHLQPETWSWKQKENYQDLNIHKDFK